MDIPTPEIEELFNKWLNKGGGIALFRMPWTDECCLIAQQPGIMERLLHVSDLRGKKGFVMAPFRPSQDHPLVIVRPDVTAHGSWGEIEKALASLTSTGLYPEVESSSQVDAEDKVHYEAAFHRFIQPLQDNEFQKLVLSRSSVRNLPTHFSLLKSFVEACNRYPRMMVYLCHTPVTGTWMGSTPEILLSGEGYGWHTVALAGTMPMQGEVMPTDWSEKNRAEQAYVAQYIREVVSKYGSELTEEGPYTTRAGQLVHLKSDFHFLMQDVHHLGELLDALHPTPAVCGLPKEKAYQFIEQYEGYDRRYYSGFVGRLNIEGRTDLYVNLRCMEVAAQTTRLYAGGGILAQSDVDSEWKETEEKMKTMSYLLDI